MIFINEYIFKENYIELKITGNKHDGIILIDKDDYEKVSKHSWFIKDSTDSSKGYVAAKINGKTTKLHRFILNVTDPKIIVDHKNRDIWNNMKSNLRETDYHTNNINSSFSRNNKSGRTGVNLKHKKGKPDKWVAQVTINGKRMIKTFSINLYGNDNAFNLAVKQREKWEKEFNILTERESSTTIP